jgi:hypothetical protein
MLLRFPEMSVSGVAVDLKTLKDKKNKHAAFGASTNASVVITMRIKTTSVEELFVENGWQHPLFDDEADNVVVPNGATIGDPVQYVYPCDGVDHDIVDLFDLYLRDTLQFE